jgi:hypothetical protein
MIYCEPVAPVTINVIAKFYCFMTTRILWAGIQNCQKICFSGTSCLKKSGIKSALFETWGSFYTNFKASKMLFPKTYYTNIFSTTVFSRSQNLTFDVVLFKIRCFDFLKIYSVYRLLLKRPAVGSAITLDIVKHFTVKSHFACIDEET